MSNTAESENFSIELISIANNIDITQYTIMEQESTIPSHLLFFHVKNTSSDPVNWWLQHNYFIGSDGFQYEPAQNINKDASRPETLPRHWYTKPKIQPGQTTRCITEFPEPPEDITVDTVVYEYEDDYYEIDVDHDELEEPPL